MTTREPTPSILVSYNDEPVALVNARYVSFLQQPGEPVTGYLPLRLFIYLARYAQLIASGERRGPYTDDDAQRFARAALIDPRELRGHLHETDEQLAKRFKLPREQIVHARQELGDGEPPDRGLDG